jgi:hypothetical protein
MPRKSIRFFGRTQREMIKGLGLICPFLISPISILEMGTKEEWKREKAQAV